MDHRESILGAILFMLYTTPLDDIYRKHNLNYYMYADDIQWYTAFKPSTAALMNTIWITCMYA